MNQNREYRKMDNKYESLKIQILSSLKINNKMQQVNRQIQQMMMTQGNAGKNNLQTFHKIWKNSNGKCGNKNAINSWTAYCLGMTTQKPNQEKSFLQKRRTFSRVSFPDIDSDFCCFRRQQIYDYLIQKYGRQNVGNIGTYQGIKMKAAIRRIGKAIDVADAFHKGDKQYTTQNQAKVTQIIQSLPKQRGAKIVVTLQDGTNKQIKTIQDGYKYCPDFKAYMDKYPDIRKYSKYIQGLSSSFGIHPAGVCLSNVPLQQIAPMRTSNKGIATQYIYEQLQSIGLIKFDILALSTLTVIQRCIKLIKDNYGIIIDLNKIPLDDTRTLDLFRSGKTTGVFQCQSYGMQATLKQMQTSHFNDVVAAIAMFRPGPMDSIPQYCQIKKGQKKPDYLHPSIQKIIKPILDYTYGKLVYQQQIMIICKDLGGMTVTQGYDLIKGIGKKKEQLISKYRTIFINGAIKKGVPQGMVQKYWDHYIVPFANYGFNKAHALSYGILSNACCYLKANYPQQFFISHLNVENLRKKHDKITNLQSDLKRFDIQLYKKDINTCDVEYKIIRKRDPSKGLYKSQIMPSIMVKGMGEQTAANIVKNRPYADLRDLAYKTDSKLVTKESLDNLIQGGFYDDMFKTLKSKDKTLTRDKFKQKSLQKFVALKLDQKAAVKKGVGTQSLFD